MLLPLVLLTLPLLHMAHRSTSSSGPDFLDDYFDLLKGPARPWAYPFGGGAAPRDLNLPKVKFRKPAESWEAACSRKRLSWLEKQAWARPPKPRASGVLKTFATTGGIQQQSAAAAAIGHSASSSAARRRKQLGGGSSHACSAPDLMMTPTAFFESMTLGRGVGHVGAASPTSSTAAAHEDDPLFSSASPIVAAPPQPLRPSGHSGAPLLVEPPTIRPLLARRLLDAYPHEKPEGLTLPADAGGGIGLAASQPAAPGARPRSASAAALRQKQEQHQQAWLRRRGQLQGGEAPSAAPARPRRAASFASGMDVSSRAMATAVGAAKGGLLSTEEMAEMLDVAREVLAVSGGDGDRMAEEAEEPPLFDGDALFNVPMPPRSEAEDASLRPGAAPPSPRPPFPHGVASRPQLQATFDLTFRSPLSMGAPNLGITPTSRGTIVPRAPDLGAARGL